MHKKCPNTKSVILPLQNTHEKGGGSDSGLPTNRRLSSEVDELSADVGATAADFTSGAAPDDLFPRRRPR